MRIHLQGESHGQSLRSISMERKKIMLTLTAGKHPVNTREDIVHFLRRIHRTPHHHNTTHMVKQEYPMRRIENRIKTSSVIRYCLLHTYQ